MRGRLPCTRLFGHKFIQVSEVIWSLLTIFATSNKHAVTFPCHVLTIIKTAWATAGAVLWNSLLFTDIQLLRKRHLQLKIAGWFPPKWHLLKNRIKFCYEYFVLQTRAGAHHWHHLFPVEHSRWYDIFFQICIANAWCLQPLKMKMVQIRGGRRGRVENRSPGQKLVVRGPLIRVRVDFHYRVIFTCVHTYILRP